MNNNSFITFIIPTIGRNTLLNSIKSLINQTDSDWKAIIIFDGIKNNFLINDNRITILEIEKTGDSYLKNKSGLVRNIGINNVEKSDWIGFLDDDDILSSNYINNLKTELSLNNFDVCIFRMGYENGYILPSKYDRNIIKNRVGISFALKTDISKKINFLNNPFEDYFYLKELQKNKYKILISSFVSYYIRTEEYKCDLYPKILLY